MNATQILSEEHQNILKVIAAIEKECEKLDSGQKIDEDFFTRSIDFIRNYADKFHHAKEEDILFKEFCKDTSKVHCNPVDQMLHEYYFCMKQGSDLSHHHPSPLISHL